MPDDFDHVQSVTNPYGKVGYSFDSMGHLLSITYPSGLVVSYAYDNANHLNTVTLSSDSVPMVITPDQDGRLSTMSYPNGAIRTNVYNNNQISYIGYGNVSNWHKYGYWTYAYDAAGRVTSITGVPVGMMAYVAAPAMTATYDDSNHLSSLNGVGTTFNGYQSMVTGGGLTFTYDARGNINGVSGGGASATYVTNPLGLRDTKTVGTTTTHYIYDLAGHLIAEVDANNNTLCEYVWVGDIPVIYRVYSNGSATEYNIYADYLNTPRAITSSTNAIVWAWNSDPYGNGTPSSSTGLVFNLRFAGQYYDAESGLHYNGARYYDPRTGRYVQSDPLVLGAGKNTYQYAGGSPIEFVDPHGQFIWVVGGAVAGAVFGGAAGAMQAIATNGSLRDVATAAATGAIGGGVSGALATESLIIGAGVGALISGATDAINQEEAHGCINLNEVGAQTVLGFFTGVVGGRAAGSVFGQMASPSLAGSAFGASQLAHAVGAGVSTAGSIAGNAALPQQLGGF